MPSSSANIVVVGSANTDLVVRVPTLPRPGETVIGGTFASVGGGKGANQAVAAARAGGRTTFITKLGADAMGDAAVAAFAADGIDTTFITRDPATPSGVAFIIVDDRGENSIAVASGANDRLTPADVDRASAAIRAADILLVQLEIPLETVRHAITVAHAAGVPVILNPAPARPLDAGLLAHGSAGKIGAAPTARPATRSRPVTGRSTSLAPGPRRQGVRTARETRPGAGSGRGCSRRSAPCRWRLCRASC